MPRRKEHTDRSAEDYHEYRTRERVERGEKVTGELGDWLDRRGPAARVARRADAERRHDARGERGR